MNEVEIRITATDLTGPAFAGAAAKMAAFKKAAGTVDIGSVLLPPDVSKVNASLIAVKQKIQSLGIADLADVNIQPGVLMSKLMLLKHMVHQAGISDLLDVNIDNAALASQLSKLGHLSETIPVNFAIGDIPKLGPTQNIADKFSIMGLDAAAAQLAATKAQTDLLAASLLSAADKKDRFASNVTGTLTPALRLGWGWFGNLNRQIPLFGGALAGLPLLGAIGGVHLLVDATAELLAVVLPAGAALASFGVAAVPTVRAIYGQMKALYTTTQAFGDNIYPLTGGLSAMASAVKPEVYQLFGDALVVMGAKTGEFITLAKEAGQVVDSWGTRLAVALTSGGFSSFMASGAKDLAVIGDIVGNIFGTVGNLLKTMPGYAQILFGALDGLTKGLEAITANPFVQEIAGWGLAVHGFVVWGGLGATAAAALGNAIFGLGAKLGFVSGEFVAFDAVQFGAGLSVIGHAALDAGAALITMGSGEDIAAAGAAALDGAMIALDAVNPVIWIGAAIGGLAALVLWLGKSASATQGYDDAVKSALGNVPVSSLSLSLTQQMANTTGRLADAQRQLASTQEYTTGQLGKYGGQVNIVTGAYKAQLGVISGYKNELGTLSGYQHNYNTLLKVAGGNTALFTQANITSSDILNANAGNMQQYTIELQAAADANRAMALGVGRNAAAINAQTNAFMTGTVPALQTVTQAEDSLLNVILGGRQTFLSFQQSIQGTSAKLADPSGLSEAAKVAGASFTGLNQQSINLGNTFYNTSVPALQKVIDSLQQQSISTGDLTSVIATGASEMLQYTHGNTEANSVIVSLINNALGPGTVSLKSLNTWVGHNSTSLQGMNSIIAKSTIAAGGLANVLQTQLTAQFQADLLKSSGATQAMQNFTSALVHGGQQSDAFRNARLALITDLENTGLSARAAKGYVNHLQNQINSLHGKTVNIDIVASGQGGVKVTGPTTSSYISFAPYFTVPGHAAGGLLPGFGGGDVLPALLEPGEAIVDKQRTRRYAPLLKAMGVPGFGNGGVVGWENYASNIMGSDAQGAYGGDLTGIIKSIATAVKRTSDSSPYGGPGGGAPYANMLLAKSLYPAYSSGPVWDAWNNVAMAESGWNQFADNASSGAYGIAQALPFTKYPRAGWPAWAGGSSNPTAQITWMWDYMAQRWGGPIGAWSNEQQYHWYDNGGWLKPGMNVMMNGTGGWEHLSRDSRPGRGTQLEVVGGSTPFEKFMAEFIREFVRVRGGGDVQRAFGSREK